MDQIEIATRSLRCFAAGWLGLVPVLGLPGAVIALLEYRAVVLGRGRLWNPADRYLLCGFILGGLGLFQSLLLFGLAMFALLTYVSG